MVVRLVAASLLLATMLATPARAQSFCHRAVDQLGQLADTGGYREGLALSPDGRMLAFTVRRANVSDDAYSYSLVTVSTESGESRVLADMGDIILAESGGRRGGGAVDRTPSWSPDGRRLAYVANVEGRAALWQVQADGTARREVNVGDVDVLRFAWTPDSQALIAETTHLRSSLAAIAHSVERDGFRVDTRFDASYALFPMMDRGRRLRWAAIDPITPARDATNVEARLLSSSRPGIGAWIAPVDPESRAMWTAEGVYYQDRAGQEQRCVAEACSGALYGAWRDGADIYVLRGHGFNNAETALYAWRPADNSSRLIWHEAAWVRDCHFARGELFCLRETSTEPRRVIAINPHTGSVRTIFDANPDWPYFRLTRVRRLDVTDAIGNESFGFLVYPSNYVRGRRFPLVIVQYRARGFLAGGVGGEYPVQAYAQCGFFVLAVERPDQSALAATLSISDFVRQTELDHSEQTVKQAALDLLLDQVIAERLVDPDRVGITGLSDGAETVYWALTHSRRFAAAVASTPPTDPSFWSLASEDFRRAQALSLGMTGPDDASSPAWQLWWRENAPLYRLNELNTPLLMQLAESEAISAMPLYARLRERGRAVEAFIYPRAYHFKWRPRQLRAAQHRALAWMNFWLRDVADEDADDPERIARWRIMREARHDLH